MTPAEIIGHARECIGTPFQHQGRICGVALDCAGVICHVAKRLGFDPIETPGYGRSPGLGLLEAAADAQPYLIRVSDRQPGDVLMMRFEGDPQHVSIFTGESVIHALWANRKVVEHRLDEVWEGRIVRVYRFTSPVVNITVSAASENPDDIRQAAVAGARSALTGAKP